MGSSRRRRGSRRRRRKSRAPLYSGIFVAVLALAGGAFAYSKGALDSLLSSNGTPSDGVSAPASRLHGAEGVDVGAAVPTHFWWAGASTDVWGQITVDAGASPLDPATTDPTASTLADQYQRLLIPASLLFGANSSVLSVQSKESLQAVASTVQDPTLPIIVVCHSSADGKVERRQSLSDERAANLAGALETLLGRPAGSIQRAGKGDTEPLPGVDQNTPTGLALNRRCEVYLQLRS